ncbi:cholecystokinin receptor type A-like [Glandiceps talaboti]
MTYFTPIEDVANKINLKRYGNFSIKDFDQWQRLADFCNSTHKTSTNLKTADSELEKLVQLCNSTIGDWNSTDYSNASYDDIPLKYPNVMDGKVLAFLYSFVFLLAVVGNAIVLITIIQNRRMRNVTNLFLFSLALSDLLFVIFCMPSTIVGIFLQRFIFGAGFCRFIVYFQVISVFVSVWTLVAISMERYFAICRPLSSRRWQTKRHAYQTIGLVWFAAFVLCIPSVVFANLRKAGQNIFACDEQIDWPNLTSYQVYITWLFVIMMVVPLMVMSVAYSLVIKDLWHGMQNEHQTPMFIEDTNLTTNFDKDGGFNSESANGVDSFKRVLRNRRRRLRSSASNAAKRRVVGMLIVVVVLFFICWTPFWVLNIWFVYDPMTALKSVTAIEAAVIKLVMYMSCCVNPVVYCFMLKKFRQGLMEVCSCCGWKRERNGDGFGGRATARTRSSKRTTQTSLQTQLSLNRPSRRGGEAGETAEEQNLKTT